MNTKYCDRKGAIPISFLSTTHKRVGLRARWALGAQCALPQRAPINNVHAATHSSGRLRQVITAVVWRNMHLVARATSQRPLHPVLDTWARVRAVTHAPRIGRTQARDAKKADGRVHLLVGIQQVSWRRGMANKHRAWVPGAETLVSPSISHARHPLPVSRSQDWPLEGHCSPPSSASTAPAEQFVLCRIMHRCSVGNPRESAVTCCAARKPLCRRARRARGTHVSGAMLN